MPAATGADLQRRLFPFLGWLPAVNRANLRPDLEAGLVGAVLILPQAIALATLAGMPPEYGIYASIIPVIVASLWGSSWHTLSGPNTAVCVLIAYSVAPFASAGTADYIGFVLALTLMAGVVQLMVGVLKLGAVLDFISHTVISAIVLAVSLIIIVSAGSSFMGLLPVLDEPFFVRLYQLAHDVSRANVYALAVGIATVVAGLWARRRYRRYALVIAVAAGSFVCYLINGYFGAATTEIELIGNLSISLLPLSAPTLDLESMYILKELVTSAFAIAFLGLMQTIVISRSLAAKSGQHIDTNQEIIGQGLSNIVAAFFSSFAGSGSFNRSAAHYEAGARTPMAAIFASLMLAIIVLLAASLIAYMAMPAVAGTLVLVGYGLVDTKEIKRALLSRQEAFVFFITFFVALAFGLNSGVFIGVVLSLVIYLWYASTPNIVIEEHAARDGRPVTVVTIDGNLFFGSVRYVERALAQIGDTEPDNNILLIRSDHLTYIDVPGAAMLAEEAKRRRQRGDDVYLYVTRSGVTEALEKSGLFDVFGRENVIHKGFDHPMKDILYPQHSAIGGTGRANTAFKKGKGGELTMEELVKRLRASRLIGALSAEQLNTLLSSTQMQTSRAGDIIARESDRLGYHILLLDGEIETQRTWVTPEGAERTHTKTFRPSEKWGGFSYISAATQEVRIRAVTACRYLPIDADQVDEMVGWSQQFAADSSIDPELAQRMKLVRQLSVFHHLPAENIKEAFRSMTQRPVQAGETIVTQGEEGDNYYIIEKGEAEVWKTDPFTEENARAARLGAGDAFGEEALLQGGYRNATVTMTTPGNLLVLAKDDFDRLINPAVVNEVSAEEAHELLQSGQAALLDCRYDMEYEESRIPGANLLPLHRMRWDVYEIDPDQTYVVYCRSGRRSKAAAYLLRERNIKAMSMKGGIKSWPYEIDEEPIDILASN